MEVGTDNEGRAITYDQATGRFAIGGIETSIDRLVAYDRGGNVHWVSAAIQSWAYEFEMGRRAHVERQQDAASARELAEGERRSAATERIRRTVAGYDAQAIARYAGTLNGLATGILVVSTGLGAFNGFIIGVVAAKSAPFLLLLLPLVFGAMGFAVGYLLTIALRALASLMMAVVQIEMNTRPGESASS